MYCVGVVGVSCVLCCVVELYGKCVVMFRVVMYCGGVVRLIWR